MGFASVTQFLGGLAFFLTIGAVAVIGEAFTWLYELDWFNIIGMSGMILLVISYTLLQLGKVHTGLNYSILNLIAAVMLAISLTEHFNMASMFIEVFWITMSIYGIWKGLQEKREIKRQTRRLYATYGAVPWVPGGFYVNGILVCHNGQLWTISPKHVHSAEDRPGEEPKEGSRLWVRKDESDYIREMLDRSWNPMLQYQPNEEVLYEAKTWICAQPCINERPRRGSPYWYCPALSEMDPALTQL